MLTKWITFILFISSKVTLVNCQTANILFTSSANYRVDKLKFGCSPGGGGWNSLHRVTLSKNISTSTSLQEIVRVELDTAGVIRNKTTWGTGNYQSRAQMIRQYVNPLTGAGVEFDIPPESVQCTDEGLYHCEVDGASSGNTWIKKISSGTVSLEVVPTSISPITVFPTQQEFIYNPMSEITMTCRGEVGRPAGDLTWCYKNSNSPSFTGWPFASDIKQETATQSGCNFVRSSTLTYNVSADYSFTEFKCVSGSTSCNGGQNTLSANVTIFRYTAPTETPDSQTGIEKISSQLSSTPTNSYHDIGTVTENGKPLSSNDGCDCDHSVAIAVSVLVGMIVGGFVVVVVMYVRENLIDKSGTKNPRQDKNGITQHVYNQPVTDTQAAYYTTVK